MDGAVGTADRLAVAPGPDFLGGGKEVKALRAGIVSASALLTAALAWVGCGHKEGDGHDHGTEKAHVEGEAGHGEESPSGHRSKREKESS